MNPRARTGRQRRLLFVSQAPFYPDSSHGADLSTLYLLRALRRRGWETEILCGLPPSSRFLRSPETGRWQPGPLLRKPPVFVTRETGLGFPCWRLNAGGAGFRWWLDQRLRRFRPDIVMGHVQESLPLLRHAARRGHRSVYCLHDGLWLRRKTRFPKEIGLIANSPFLAREVLRRSGRSVPVVSELVEAGRFRARRHLRRTVTFVNPIPEKGVAVAVEVARRLPKVPFLFVQGNWWRYGASNPLRAYGPFPPNITLWEHQEDMRPVYALTRLLLVPSQWVETFARVILEAHMNGIPVVASRVGGIPDTMGQGGILVSPKDDVEKYVLAIQGLLSDKKRYRRISILARRNSRRPEFHLERQASRFRSLLENGSP